MLKKREIEYIQSNWEQHFDAPPFNYCDRLCEECCFTHCCSLYYDEKKWKLKVLRQDKDPDDPKMIAKSMKDSFVEMGKILKKMTEKEGIEPGNLEDFEQNYTPPPSSEKIPVCRDAKKWLKMILKIFKKITKNWEKYSMPVFLIPQVSKLEHYAFFAPSKLYRAMLYFYRDREGGKKREWEYDDAVKSACLALCAIQFCSGLIRSIAELKTQELGCWCAETMILSKKLEEQIKKKFPNVERYRSKIVFNSI